MRRYRRDRNGQEQPVWLRANKIRDLGTREGEEAARDKRQPIHWGNTIYDAATQLAFTIKSKEMKLGRKLTDGELNEVYRGLEKK